MKNTGDGRRVQRVEREIQHVIAGYFISGFKGTLPGLVTVARVIMPKDLRTAKVYISVLGADFERDNVIKLLNDRSYEVQNHLGRELKMRYCPRLTFFLDDTTEHVLKIDRILYDLDKERELRVTPKDSEDSSTDSE